MKRTGVMVAFRSAGFCTAVALILSTAGCLQIIGYEDRKDRIPFRDAGEDMADGVDAVVEREDLFPDDVPPGDTREVQEEDTSLPDLPEGENFQDIHGDQDAEDRIDDSELSCYANGTACTSGSQCCSSYCVDGVCCNNACDDSTCQRCDSYSNAGAGTCGYIGTAVDPDDECGTTGCYNDLCSGTGYACGYYTSGEHNCTAACTTCQGATSGSCVTMSDNTQDTEGSNTCSSTCKKCSGGICINQSATEDLFDQCGGASCCGKCSGSGSCSYVANGSTCSSPGDSCTAEHYRCNGSGSCFRPCLSTPIACIARGGAGWCTQACTWGGYCGCYASYSDSECTVPWGSCGSSHDYCECTGFQY
jgi:hypothetical protein